MAMGAAMVAAPRPFALGLAGKQGRNAGPQLITRAAGAREAALGTAAAVALAKGRDARLWTAAQLGADLTDLVATAASGNDIPRVGRRVGLAMAGTATAVLAGALVGMREESSETGDAGASAGQTMPSRSTADGVGTVTIGGESQDDPGAGGTAAA
jgi:hypothetical protein